MFPDLRPLSPISELTAHTSCTARITVEKASINTEQNKSSLSFLVCIVNTAAQNFHTNVCDDPLIFLSTASSQDFSRKYDVFYS